MFRSRRLRLLGAGALLGTLSLVAVAPAIGGTGIGSIFNLGKTNTVNRTSVLTGNYSSRILQITNGGTGTALQLTTKTTVPPMKVNSSVKVANLNADKLDGIDSTGFMASGAHPDAATLDGLDSTAFMQPTGQILVSAGNGGWRTFTSADPMTRVDFSSTTQWTRTSAGSSFLSVSPDLPVAMYGRMLQLQGVEFCYGTPGDVTLNYVEINTTSSSNGESARQLRFSDPTTYSDDACHLYTLATPVALGSETGANFFIQVGMPTVGGIFAVNRTTFILAATTASAPAPAAVVITGSPVKAGAKSATDVPSK